MDIEPDENLTDAPTDDATPERAPHPFRVWAPRARERVTLILDEEEHPMQASGDGWWEVSADVTGEGFYQFRLDDGDPRPDPRALRMPESVHGRSQLFDPYAFTWSDAEWEGVALPKAVIYEMHVGTFTPDGTFDAAIERLDHLVDLGVSLVEVMPVHSFPGQHGWGYDGVALYAVHEPYGGPAAFQRFVDACHARGLGVCLDVVYNHFGPSGNYLGEFAPYFTDQHLTPWGKAVNLDGPGSDNVQTFLLDNALMWLREYHCDALRLDAIHALFDDRALTFVEQLSAATESLATELGRPLWLIGESDRNDPRTVMPRDVQGAGAGGMGLDAQWADDVHHALHVLLTGETAGYYADFADPGAIEKVLRTPFFHDGAWSSFRRRHHGRPVPAHVIPGWKYVASLQTHDQVGNRARGNRMSQMVSPGRLAAGAALLMASPYTPMLFMGEEWGASTPWQFFTDHEEHELVESIRRGREAEFAGHGWEGEVPDPQDRGTLQASKLAWDEVHHGHHARLLDFYRTLIRLRRELPDLSNPLLDNTNVYRGEDGTLVVHRGECRVLVNLDTEPHAISVGDPRNELVSVACWGDDIHCETDTPGIWTLPPDGVVVLAPRPQVDAAESGEERSDSVLDVEPETLVSGYPMPPAAVDSLGEPVDGEPGELDRTDDAPGDPRVILDT